MMSSSRWTCRMKPKVPEDKVEYETPSNYELEKLLNHGSVSYTHVNEVWPNVLIGDEQTARDCHGLQKLKVTHILNAAEGERNSVCTGASYYSNLDVEYYGKLLVHCVMGRSRSATLVLAYLMIEQQMTLVEAIEQVKRCRRILPNWGFLKQLRELDAFLQEHRREHPTTGATATDHLTEGPAQ